MIYPSNTRTDAEIWDAFQEGKEWALEYIYVAQFKYLLNYGLRFCRDKTQVEDHIHDLFVEIWNHRRTLSRTQSIRFYLLRVLRNKIYRHSSQPENHVRPLEDSEHYPFWIEYSFEDALIEQTISQEQKEKVLHVLNNLPARQKEVLYLRFYHDLTYEEICEVMGISYQTARNQFHQALKSLRRDMAASTFICLALLKNFF
jgi:RNA polymerase sigma factor (sigma-70 family)